MTLPGREMGLGERLGVVFERYWDAVLLATAWAVHRLYGEAS